VKANLENVLFSWEFVGGLEVFQVPSIEVNTNHKIVLGLNVDKPRLKNCSKILRLKISFYNNVF
jgi:hypothetical protein